MAKQDFPEKQTWGTLEELLLGCAVDRHGADNWDSVAGELQKRSSAPHLFTPQSCHQKYLDLKRRYHQYDVVENDKDRVSNSIPWLDELRKLRVAELQREVERYDHSILSLQQKVKRLKEEREKSLQEGEKDAEKPDLERNDSKHGAEDKEVKDEKATEELSPDSVVGKPDGGECSVKESNSTDPKADDTEKEKAPEPVAGEQVQAGDDSCDGSSDTVAKETAREKSERVNSGREAGDSHELGESVAESKGGAKESSDVQSSASLSRKKEEPDEPDNEEGHQSNAKKRMPVESQPLMEFLKILRSHKCSSLVERRLESQESAKYTNAVRQHMDFETIRSKLREGYYAGSSPKFFRDLLLVVNNALVCFDKKSSESEAAAELRTLIKKEMACLTSKSDPSSTSKAPIPGFHSVKAKTDLSDSLLAKSKISLPLTACRKRSSIAAKGSSSSSGADKRRAQTATLLDEKPSLDSKQTDKSSSLNAEENRVTKKRTRERFPSAAKGSNKNSKSQSNADKHSDNNVNTGSEKGAGENSGSKTEKKNTSSSAKKQSAANFLNRMKQSPSSNNSTALVETSKSSKIRPETGKGSEQKKTGATKGDAKKDQRRGSASKQVKEKGSPTKKNVGRPPKRAAAPSPSTPAVPAKRTREAGEASGSRQTKKRARK